MASERALPRPLRGVRRDGDPGRRRHRDRRVPRTQPVDRARRTPASEPAECRSRVPSRRRPGPRSSQRGPVTVDGPVRAVPLDQRVHHPEQQPADQLRRDVRAQRPLVDGRLHQAGQLVVDDPPALERGELDLAVAAQPQQQGHGRHVGGQDLDGLPDRVPEPLVGARLRRGADRLVDRGGETVECLVERGGQQRLLARHVVVDRRLGHPELARQVADAGRLVALPVEQLDRPAQHRRGVVPGSSAPRRCFLGRLHHGLIVSRARAGGDGDNWHRPSCP